MAILQDQLLAIALRVLNTARGRGTPAPVDIALLRMWIHPKNHGCDPDELACIAINAELRRREESSAVLTAGN